ncbi:Lrp/AsnC family transcriptional regulator [Candidatus Woesearchaeota archaeon]|nr:Lrp/AsnC family transcriptional regulator [Candidatus Woesearchaeota archaeon]
MKLTRNEKKTLKLLLDNSRISDREIASKLNISSVAVGKIRRKLESQIIESYTLNLNYAKLGIRTFAIAVAKLTKEGLDKGELEVEQKLLRNPHIINVYRIPKGSSTHIILYGFEDMTELDDFFHSLRLKEELHKFIETQELFTFSHNSLIKNSPIQLFHKVVDHLRTRPKGIKFNELENFKKRLR